MQEIDSQEKASPLRFKCSGDPPSILSLSGTLDIVSCVELWDWLREHPPKKGESPYAVDVSGISDCDGAGFSLLHSLSAGDLIEGMRMEIKGFEPRLQKIFDAYAVSEDLLPAPAEEDNVIEDLGRTARGFVHDIRAQIAFIGETTRHLLAAIFRPKQMRWGEVFRIFEQAGVKALPLVSLISGLVGLVIAFEAATPLAQFGAQVFIANMIGLIMIRELGPVMTAILFAGRSGSAFAAELGTMKVNEELNALETMGLNPIRFLVVQRVMAGILLMPVLTIYSMLMGVGGGVVVMLALGFPMGIIYDQMLQSVHLRDILFGTFKGAVFGLLVSGIGCLRGLQTKQGPSAVGESTTRAVVSGIILIILVDAVLAVLYYILFD